MEPLEQETENSWKATDNADMIDFDLKNHTREAFGHLLVFPLKNFAFKCGRIMVNLAVGSILGLLAALAILLAVLQYKDISNSTLLKRSIKTISEVFPNKKIEIKAASFSMQDVGCNMNILLDNVKIDGLLLPKISAAIDSPATIKSGNIKFKNICIHNADIHLVMNGEKKKQIFIFNQQTEGLYRLGSVKKNTFKNLSSRAVINLVDSKITYHSGKKDWKINNCNMSLTQNSLLPKIANFAIQLSSDSKPCDISLKIDHAKDKINIASKISKIDTKNFREFIHDSQANYLYPVSDILEGKAFSVSGAINLTLYKNGTTEGNFDLETSPGSITSPFLQQSVSFKKSIPIDSLKIRGEILNDTLKIKDLAIYDKKSIIRLTGASISLKGEENSAEIDGTLELVNAYDFNILPNTLLQSCMSFVNSHFASFKLPFLKMDIKGSFSPSDILSVNQIKASHGIFEINSATLKNNKQLKDISAVIEHTAEHSSMTIKSAVLNDDIIISGGKINYQKEISGSLEAKIPVTSLTKISNIALFESIPIKLLDISDKVEAKLTVKMENNEFKILDTTGVINSPNNKEIIDIKLSPSRCAIKGTAISLKGGIIKIDSETDNITQKIQRKISVSKDESLLAHIMPFLGQGCQGDFEFNEIFESTKGQGTYSFKLDLNNAQYKLPVLGNIKDKSSTGIIQGEATVKGNILSFTNINLKSDNVLLQGALDINKKTGDILSLVISEFTHKNTKLHCQAFSESNNSLDFTIKADNVDLTGLTGIIKRLNTDKQINLSLNLNQIKIDAEKEIKNLQGNISMKKGHIVGGSLAGTLPNGSTFILESTLEANNSLVKLSCADAEELFGLFEFLPKINGGRVIISMASDITSTQDLSVINCEITDVIIKNNKNLAKLISLSSPNAIADINNFSVGFNGIVCNMTMTREQILVNKGMCIGPLICISFQGIYDRINDKIDIKGITTPVLMQNLSGSQLYAPYKMSGTLMYPEIEVNPLESSPSNLLKDIFGINIGNATQHVQHEKISDFSIESLHSSKAKTVENSMDNIVNPEIVDLEKVSNVRKTNIVNAKNTTSNKKKRMSTKTEFGATITRGR